MQKSNKIISGNNKFSEKSQKLFLNLVNEIGKKKSFTIFIISHFYISDLWNKNLFLFKKKIKKKERC